MAPVGAAHSRARHRDEQSIHRADGMGGLSHRTGRCPPAIEAIAVTDYYVTDTYEEVLRHKANGRLPGAKLVFPNVELRLDVATTKVCFGMED